MSVRPTTQGLALGPKIRLAAEILVVYGRVRWWMWRRTFPDALRALRGGARPGRTRAAARVVTASHPDDRLVSERLGYAVVRTLSPLPGDSRCLMRSLVLTNLLSRRGIASSVVIGVTPPPEFAAHAWVEQGGVPVTHDGDVYTRLLEV